MKRLHLGEYKNRTDVWLTPPEIIKALGTFDLDPCSPINRPWNIATHHLTELEDGLLTPWNGRVWMNPPFSNLIPWFSKMALHNNGIALTPARTETNAFHKYVFPHACSLFFFYGRLFFYDATGKVAKHNAGTASILIAYNEFNSDAIETSGLSGVHIPINSPDIFIVTYSSDQHTWKVIVRNAVEELGGTASTTDIYETVVRIAPKRVQKNKHYKEKIRQTLQRHFTRQEQGKYSIS